MRTSKPYHLSYSDKLPRVASTGYGVLIERNGDIRLAPKSFDWFASVARADAHSQVMRAFGNSLLPVTEPDAMRLLRTSSEPLVDVNKQFCLAFGVTVAASESARNDEYQAGGNASAVADVSTSSERAKDTPYTRVGSTENPPELFVKAQTQSDIFTEGMTAGIRSVEAVGARIEGEIVSMPPWNIHEAEWNTVAAPEGPEGTPVAFSLSFDMSCRRDEGISPMLLLYAKKFWHAAGYGRWFTVPEDPWEFWNSLTLTTWVRRGGEEIWPPKDAANSMNTSQVRRPLRALLSHISDMGYFEDGKSVNFMSGTGIVPRLGDTFSLMPGDQIAAESPELGSFYCSTELIPKPRRDLAKIPA